VDLRGEPARVARTFEHDESIRGDTSAEKLAALPAQPNTTQMTAGNSSPLNDGASAIVLASAPAAEELGVEPLARVVAGGVAGVDPAYMGIGPVRAVPRALENAGLTIDQIDLVELNEAFASQVLASARELGIEEERLNVNGGAIALGHPLGCSGARLTGTLVRELRRRGGKYGIATLCVGVGQGSSTVFEAV
jgi:acetyl-CoA acyltransferase